MSKDLNITEITDEYINLYLSKLDLDKNEKVDQ